MNNIDKQYQALLQDVLDNGVQKKDRTGTGTLSVFGRQIRHKMSEGFPLLTTKKMYFKGIVTELLWFLRGDTNIKFLHDNNCHIWDGDYEKSGRTDGDLGPIYGKQWRSWHTGWDIVEDKSREAGVRRIEYRIDQIANAIEKLKTNPDDRGIIVSAWNVGELDQMVLRPCHNFFQFYTRELSNEERRNMFPKLNEMFLEKKKNMEGYDFDSAAFYREKEKQLLETLPTRAISLMWNQRSVDTFLGLPFNIASYALLLEIFAREVNMVPEEVIGNLGDVHLYLNHIEQAKEQISREPYELPSIKIQDEVKWKEGDCLPFYSVNDFSIENYKSHLAIKAPLSN